VRDQLVQLRMLVEATLDFPEEEIDFLEQADARGRLTRLRQGLQEVLGHARQGALLREGLQVVIAGQPNAGKSSLLNALAGAELAIVTEIPGTTRDKVQQTIQIEGVPVHVVDTAGLRASEDAVESIGIARAWEAIEHADAVIFLHDLTRADAPEYVAADAQIAEALDKLLQKNVPVLQVWNKADALQTLPPLPADALTLSARHATGLEGLRQALLQAAGWQPTGSSTYVARARHIDALRTVDLHLGHALSQLDAKLPALDLMAEELRLGQNALNAITGEFTSDDLLGVIFSKFCIGK
jgi:tRNA modification GTPase